MKRIAVLMTAPLVAGPVLAQSVGEKTGVNSTLGIAPTTADFVKEVTVSDIFELQTNKLGAERGNAQEKTFAAMMMKDHTKTSDELKAMAKSGDVKANATASFGNGPRPEIIAKVARTLARASLPGLFYCLR